MKKEKVLPIALGVVCLIATVFVGLFFFTRSTVKETIAAKSEAVKLAQEQTKLANAYKADAESQKSAAETAISDQEDLQIALDTIQPKALLADSLQLLANDLQKQLAACASSSSKKVDKSQKVAVVSAKKLKGNPVVDTNAKTFTYCKSDSLLAKAAPSGYKLIAKPR